MQLVQHTINSWDVAVVRIDITVIIQNNDVVFRFADRQFVVIYIRQRELCIFFSASN